MKEVRLNLNKFLYPNYAEHIDVLEGYIQNLKNEGVRKENKVKHLSFRSDRAEKLKLAEGLKDTLIAFEEKKPEERSTNIPISIEALDLLIDQNKKATGSVILHGRGNLDRILKNLQKKIKQEKDKPVITPPKKSTP